MWLTAGEGKFTINERSDEDYFSRPTARMVIRQALEEVTLLAQYDVIATVAVAASPRRPARSVTASRAR